MIYIIVLIVVSVFWTLNMGASNFAVSFSPSVGSDIIKKNKAILLFTVFVLVGSLLLGGNVAKTLSSKIIPKEYLNGIVILIILFSASVSLFVANIIKIPQSTSITVVGSFAGAGLFFGVLNYFEILKMALVWITVSMLSYYLTYFIAGRMYPPSPKNFRFHEKLFKHEGKLKRWTLWTDCYSAFGCGTNNVANVVGPLVAAGILGQRTGFLVFAPLFGLGAFLFGRGVLNTISKEVVPLGVASASVVSLVVSSFIVFCSLLGIPAPYVQFSSASILAVQTVKEETEHTKMLFHPITKKIFLVWAVTPAISLSVSYILLKVII